MDQQGVGQHPLSLPSGHLQLLLLTPALSTANKLPAAGSQGHRPEPSTLGV